MDVEFYGALRGRQFDDEERAATDFAECGMLLRLSPHPFLDFVSLPPDIRQAWRKGKVGRVLEHLTGDDGQVRPMGPLAEPTDPVAARTHLLDLAKRLGRETLLDGHPEVSTVDWSTVDGQRRRPGTTSVVMMATQVRQTHQTVQSLLRHSAGRDVEVVVVDRGSPAHEALGLHAAFFECPDVEVIRVPIAATDAEAANLALAHASGEFVVLLQPHVRVRQGWLSAVLDALLDREVAGAQPVVLQPDDTIHSAGLAVLAVGGAPVPLLVGHPKEDARRLSRECLAAISGDAMALRAADLVAVGGLDPRPTWTETAWDLCVRLLERHPEGFRVAPTASVSSMTADHKAPQPSVTTGTPPDPRIYERIGFTTELGPVGGRRGVRTMVVRGRRAEGSEQLRWSLKLPSAPGARGDRWGDTHFADALAEALRRLGQDVVTCRRGAHAAGPTHLDDVALAVRGLYPIPPSAGQVNVLWVISHPDDVDPGEFDGYDLVFAASHPWSRTMSDRSGREVVPLLQATGFEVPAVPDEHEEQPGVVFVGAATPERQRPLIWKAVEAGVPLAVYGPGWESLPEGIWRGGYVDNRSLPELYHRHGLVLADHWLDMAENGFIANRVFDALAAGARVICDDVAGVHDVFDPRDVVVARTPEDIVTAVSELGRPGEGEMRRPALSFDDRARTLLNRVRPLTQTPSARRE